MADVLVRVENLGKKFGPKVAVDGINFQITKGEIFGFLGPNGAGKTTIISMLTTLMSPSSGNAFVDNVSIVTQVDQVKPIIGVVPQEIALYDELTGRENLLFFGKLYSSDNNALKQRAEELLELIGLTDEQQKTLGKYSGGMKRRINIAVAMMNRPQFLMMDEPTVGIDPQSRENIYDLIFRIREQGTTILYTSHYMEEVEKLCDRIAIMDSGRIIAMGTLKELLKLKKDTKKEYKPSGLEDLFIQLTGRQLRN